MPRITIVTLLLVIASVPAAVQEKLAYPNVDLHGALYRAVFTSATDMLAAPDLAALPDHLRARLNRFLTRRATLGTGPEQSAAWGLSPADPRRILERAIVALDERDNARERAAEFLSEAPLARDWDENAAAPLAEASYAEKRLKPDAPLAPFLYVFIAQRQRAAFELANRANDLDTMKAAAKKYRAVMQRARSAPDPIYGLLADDLDRVEYVYAKTDQHPATFNPDT